MEANEMDGEVVQETGVAVVGPTFRAVEAVGSSDPLTIEELVGRVDLVEAVKRRVMRDGEHFGTIPGTKKPSLYQPGAQKLGMTFRLHPKYEIAERDLGNGHREYVVTCNLHNSAGGFEAACSASCSTMETRYRFRRAEQTCPKCGGAYIIKGKKEYGGGWICFAKLGGCGTKFGDGDPTIENQAMGRVEHDNPADYYNTCLKMSQKRAYVGAVIAATGGSDLFTQDVEDMAVGIGFAGAAAPHNPPSPPAQTPATPSGPSKAVYGTPTATPSGPIAGKATVRALLKLITHPQLDPLDRSELQGQIDDGTLTKENADKWTEYIRSFKPKDDLPFEGGEGGNDLKPPVTLYQRFRIKAAEELERVGEETFFEVLGSLGFADVAEIPEGDIAIQRAFITDLMKRRQ